MGIFDPETGLRYCEKHSWEQADDCLYCANESLRKEVERLRKYRDMDKRVESMQIGVDEVCRLRDTIRTLEEQLAAKDETILQQAKDITEMDAEIAAGRTLVENLSENAANLTVEVDTLRKEVERLTGVKGRLERGHDKLVEKIYDLRKEVERLREDLERGCIIDRGDGTDDVCQIYAENADLRKAKGGTVVPYNDGAR